MLASHQIVTTVLLVYIGQIYHCTEENIDNVLTHYIWGSGIAQYQTTRVSQK